MGRWLFLGLLACSDVEDPDDGHDHEHGAITTVELTFRDAAGAASVFVWDDADLDGEPTIDTLTLATGDYTLDVRFLYAHEEPVEDITEEVLADDTSHQVFFTGASVESEATAPDANAVLSVAYADQDADGLPLGLSNTALVRAAGEAELQVTLRHLPPEDGVAVKEAGLAELVADQGFSALGGSSDVQVSFPGVFTN
jgi:hypothetical protein